MNWQLSNFLRAIAITVVVWIHASHTWWFAADANTSLDVIDTEIFVNTFINQAGRFTVPLFVILSGFGLAKSEEYKPFRLKRFLQRRCFRVLPPYILFSFGHLITREQFQIATFLDRVQQFFQVLGNGSADYHLYFLAIILKCYISYPLLRHCRFSPRRLVALMIFLITLCLLYWLNLLFGLGAIAKFMPSSDHIIFWLPYFLIGIWLAREPEWSGNLVQKLTSWQWGILWAIAASIEVGEFYYSATVLKLAESAGHYGRPTVVLLSFTFLLWAMSWQTWKLVLSPKIIEISSGASFTTYLLHPDVLRVLTPLESLGGISYLLISAIASWVVGILVWSMVKSVKVLNVALGA